MQNIQFYRYLKKIEISWYAKKTRKPEKSGFFKNPGKNESFIYFLGLKYYFKLDSGVKNELNKVKTCQNVDFSVQIDLFDPFEKRFE